mgnify:CR=1 FL=1
MRYSLILNVALALYFSCSVNVVLGVEFVASIGEELELTDNSLNTESNKSKELAYTTTLEADISHRSSVFDLSLNYAAAYARYNKETQDDNNTLIGTGTAIWYILPGRIDWFVTETENFSIVDRRLADTADNRAQSSSLSTGPHVAIPISRVDSATLDAVYTQSSVDGGIEGDNESIVSSGSIGWTHLFSDIKSFSLEYSTSKTNFDNNDENVESSSVMGTLNANTASGAFVLGVGVTRFEIDSGTDRSTNSFDIQYTRRWSISTVTFLAQKELTDTVTAFRGGETSTGSSFAQSFEVEDAIIRSTLDASVSLPILGALTVLDLSVSYQEEEFQAQKDMQRVKMFDTALTHRLTEHISLAANYSYVRTQFDFIATNRVDREHQFSLGGEYQVSEMLAISSTFNLDYRQVGREENIDHSNMRKNSLLCAVSYSFL